VLSSSLLGDAGGRLSAPDTTARTTATAGKMIMRQAGDFQSYAETTVQQQSAATASHAIDLM